MFKQLDAEISTCQYLDQHRLRRQLQNIPRRRLQTDDPAVLALREAVRLSRRRCELRHGAIPAAIRFPAELPISAEVERITGLLQRHQVLVVAGDTGSGKTTQLPKICLQAGFGRRGLIGHTQPRRLAASSVADRIAGELGTRVGAGVGFQIRFTGQVSESSYLKLMTDGILLAEIQQDRLLNRYELLIIDEAHERSLNIDFLLGYLHRLARKRPELKLVITSATIDVEKFSHHFDNAPIVTVAGRTYPVTTRYLPPPDGNGGAAEDERQLEAIIGAVRDIHSGKAPPDRHGGDILVFLASEREIRETADSLRKQRLGNTEILPLYSRLRHSEQVKIFTAHGGRRIVLATNVAETSITVPGINFVIDAGRARISRYSLQSKVQRLPVEPVSQASANQRRGRCGRLANGVCIRLYSEQDFESRPAFTDPEILRTNLAAVILQMLYLGLGDIAAFPFLDPPEPKAISEGFKLLEELQAIDARRELTAAGRIMARLPLDPKLARMLVEAQARHCLSELLIITSALSIQDPREIHAGNREKALGKLSEFNHPRSDFMSFVNLWSRYESVRQNGSQSRLRKFCRSYHLSYTRMREWREVHRQLLLSCRHQKFRINPTPAVYEAVHKSLLAGSLNQIAARQEDRQFLGNRHRKFRLLPSSVLANSGAKWVITGELIETGQTFAAMAAEIQPGWAVDMAAHRIRREHLDPHWSEGKQQVMVYEKVSLYGLVLIERNPVPFKTVDPAQARELFIEQALVPGAIRSSQPFISENTAYLDRLRKEEEKYRQPDMLVSQSGISRFYRHAIPDHVSSTAELEHWLRQQGERGGKLLNMERAKLFSADIPAEQRARFPDQAQVQGNRLNIDYRFEPGAASDGASIAVPGALLAQLTQADLDWAVPGLLRDKCMALLKGLPKSLRKGFIPVGAYVDEMLPRLHRRDGDLIDGMRAYIAQRQGIKLERGQLEQQELPAYLRIKLRVLDGSGGLLAEGTDLGELRQKIPASGGAAGPRQERHPLEQDGLTDWTFPGLPRSVRLDTDLVLIRYPAIMDHTRSVSIRLLAERHEALAHSRRGIMRLFMLRSAQQKNLLWKQFVRFRDANPLKLPAGLNDLAGDGLNAVYLSVFSLYEDLPRSREAFEQALAGGKSRLVPEGERLLTILAEIAELHVELRGMLAGIAGPDYLKEDVNRQLRNLIHAGFLSGSGIDWLGEYPRYLKAVRTRLLRAPHMGEKDRPSTELMAKLWNIYTALRRERGPRDETAMNMVRWSLEEFRVSLFAQSLGTRFPVSEKRIIKQIELLRH